MSPAVVQTPVAETSPSPMTSESPVRSPPRGRRPPPNGGSVPRSIRVASSHLSARRRSPHPSRGSPGRTNRSAASGNARPGASGSACPGPRSRARAPGGDPVRHGDEEGGRDAPLAEAHRPPGLPRGREGSGRTGIPPKREARREGRDAGHRRGRGGGAPGEARARGRPGAPPARGVRGRRGSAGSRRESRSRPPTPRRRKPRAGAWRGPAACLSRSVRSEHSEGDRVEHRRRGRTGHPHRRDGGEGREGHDDADPGGPGSAHGEDGPREAPVEPVDGHRPSHEKRPEEQEDARVAERRERLPDRDHPEETPGRNQGDDRDEADPATQSFESNRGPERGSATASGARSRERTATVTRERLPGAAGRSGLWPGVAAGPVCNRKSRPDPIIRPCPGTPLSSVP